MNRKKSSGLATLLIVLFTASTGLASTRDDADLRALLDEFLAGAATIAAHQRFWSDDLVYTSSSGTRTNKSAIIESMRAAEADAAVEEPGAMSYSAEDVDIRIYGDTAVVAFRLVARKTSEAAPVSQYFNTGTFLKHDSEWRAVAWQATRIPGPGSSREAVDQGRE